MNTLLRRIGLILLFPLLLSASSHKFYVSITKVEYVREKGSLQLICKIFTDDLEDVLQVRYDSDLKLDAGGDEKRIDDLLAQYLDMKLNLWVDGQEVRLRYLGKKYEIDITRVYLESMDIPAFQTLKVRNEILMEMFEEQENIIHFKRGDSRRSLILKKDDPTGMLNFN